VDHVCVLHDQLKFTAQLLPDLTLKMNFISVTLCNEFAAVRVLCEFVCVTTFENVTNGKIHFSFLFCYVCLKHVLFFATDLPLIEAGPFNKEET